MEVERGFVVKGYVDASFDTDPDDSKSLMRTSIPLLHPQPLLLYILDQLLELAHAN